VREVVKYLLKYFFLENKFLKMEWLTKLLKKQYESSSSRDACWYHICLDQLDCLPGFAQVDRQRSQNAGNV